MSSYNHYSNYVPRGQSNAYYTPDSMYGGAPDPRDQFSRNTLSRQIRNHHSEFDGPCSHMTSNYEPRFTATATPSAHYQEAAAVCQLNPL
jgi:hypothetical protein